MWKLIKKIWIVEENWRKKEEKLIIKKIDKHF